MSRLVVTGCCGFIGSHLVDALLAAGHEVLGIDGYTDTYDRAVKQRNIAAAMGHANFVLEDADLTERPLAALLAGKDGVFHLAAHPGVRESWGAAFDAYVRDNVLAAQRVFEASAAAGVRVVLASSSSVYGDAETYPTREDAVPAPISPYGVTKLCAENLGGAYARSLGLDVVTVRYFTVYGPRQRPDMAFARIASSLSTGHTFRVFGTGEQTRDVTYVGDAVAATIAALEHGQSGAVYNVGGGSEASLLEAIRTMEHLTGRTLAVEQGDTMAGDARRTGADIALAARELGWVPRTTLQHGLAAQLGVAIESTRH